ncbi:MAG: hypothetical protein N3G76_01310 [Candidatus Micrarchaeota archaeon]|nr:hypothetical protein [Candidatus Micrarchaeota archaeon]
MSSAKYLILALVFGFALAFAGFPEELNNICVDIKAVMPLLAFTLLVFAGLIYAGGQVLGAEFRSRTNVWATTIAIGAVLGLILAFSAPWIVGVVASAAGEDIETYQYDCKEKL